MSNLRLKSLRTFNQFFESSKSFTLRDLAIDVQGNEHQRYGLLEAFLYHNKLIKESLGKDYALSTWDKYEATYRILKTFFFQKCGKVDINLSELNHQLVTEFHHYLKVKRNCSHNSAMKRLQQVKTVIKMCLLNGWTSNDPFVNFSLKTKETQCGYLTFRELKCFLEAEMNSAR